MRRTFCAGVLEAMQRFEAAVRADEFKGGGAVEDIPAIELELYLAREELEEFLSQIN